MPIVKHEIKQFQINYKCDKCGAIMHLDYNAFGAGMLKFIKSKDDKKLFKHVCPECGYELFLDTVYPYNTSELC